MRCRERPLTLLMTSIVARPKTDARVAVRSGRELGDLPDDHQAEHQTRDRHGGDRHPRAAVAPECPDAEHDRSCGERCSDPPAARRKVPRERGPGDGEKREDEGETGVVAGRGRFGELLRLRELPRSPPVQRRLRESRRAQRLRAAVWFLPPSRPSFVSPTIIARRLGSDKPAHRPRSPASSREGRSIPASLAV